MLITAIEKRRKMLSALFLDGEFAVNIDTETLLQFRYKIGMDITDEQLHELILASDARRANEKALYLLEHRSHSKKELIEKIQRTTSKEAARSAADRMEELGLVNDEEFAKRYAAELFL
ncbi:MAG: regulatory protein RecX, partial [Acutalibacteraceae bacterium]